MIISKGRGYVFVHMPKTGGTSLALALEDRAMRDDILIGDTPKAQRRRKRLGALKARGRLWKHATLADIDGILSEHELSQMFTFTLVRNPWDRIVSYYHWLLEQSFEHPDVARAKALKFDSFLMDPEVQGRLAAHPARYYMVDASGVERCSAYIRLENFAQDALPLFAHLGFEFALPHLNRSARHPEFGRHYSAEGRSIVARICADDIARFNYTFDG